MIKPITVNLPFPEIKNIKSDYRTGTLLAPSYCGAHGELSAVLSYTYQSFNFFSQEDEKTAELIKGISLAEMKHFDILGQLYCAMGIDPVFSLRPPCRSAFYSTESITFTKVPEKMLMDAIAGELIAIKEYKKVIESGVEDTVAHIISRIILDEELHLDLLKERLMDFNLKIFCP